MVERADPEAHDIRRPRRSDYAPCLERLDQPLRARMPERDEASSLCGISRACDFKEIFSLFNQELGQHCMSIMQF